MIRHLAYKALGIASMLSIISLAACEDEVSNIGESITSGSVTINVDSAAFNFPSQTVDAMHIDARSTNNLLGHISVPEYGELSASYVTQLLAAAQMNIPDSIGVDRVDSVRLELLTPRSSSIGDTLAPQQFKAYTLTKSLPEDIRSNFNPTGYYDSAKPIATKNYTLSLIALSDSAFKNKRVIPISTPLPKVWGTELFTAYRNDPSAFEWPTTLNKYFKGFYFEPSFGRGAIANIGATEIMLYYHHYVTRTVVENEESVQRQVTIKDSVCLMASGPEVLSSSIFKYKPSQNILDAIAAGKQIITAPLGYHVSFKFPVKQLLEEYWSSDVNLLMINNLTLSIPAETIDNDYGIVPPPDLLMILRKDVEDFFANGKVPDNKTSFRGTYSSTDGRYDFSTMRQYIVDLKNKKEPITDADVDFILIPVEMSTEVVNNYDGSTTTYITGCTPYLVRPAMVELHTDKAQVVFTFTQQLMK